ncbi:MAG: stalk domain-containing protein [Bacillota bacterium]
MGKPSLAGRMSPGTRAFFVFGGVLGKLLPAAALVVAVACLAILGTPARPAMAEPFDPLFREAQLLEDLQEAMAEMVLQPGSPEVRLDGRLLLLDVAPYIKNQRMMVPFRFIGESLGARVDWIAESSTAVFELPGRRIELRIGSREARVNDSTVQLDVPPEIVKGRTFVPLRFVAEGMGATVHWDDKTASAVITFRRRSFLPGPGGGTRLGVVHFHSTKLSLLASVAMMINYQDSSVTPGKVVVFGGGLGPVTPVGFGIQGAQAVEQAIEREIVLEALDTLGYSPKLACVGLPNEALLDLLKAVPLSDGMVCKSPGEALDKLKQALDSGVPVGAALDVPQLGLVEGAVGPQIVVVSGYDSQGLILEIPAAAYGGQWVSSESFLRAWSQEESQLPGPNFFFWLRRSSRPQTVGEMLKSARSRLNDSASALREYAATLEAGGQGAVALHAGNLEAVKNLGFWTRYLAADFLQQNGLTRAAARLKRAAELYESLDPSMGAAEIAEVLRQIAAAESEAARTWS